MDTKPTGYELFFAGLISLTAFALFGMIAWNASMPKIWGIKELSFLQTVCCVFVFRSFVVAHSKSSYELTSKELWPNLFTSVCLSGVFCLIVFITSLFL